MSKTATQNEISASKALKLSYRNLFRGRAQRVNFEGNYAPSAKIGDDSDGHKTREFFIDYPFIKKVSLDGQEWVFAFGEADGGYGTGGITGVLLAFPRKERLRSERLMNEINSMGIEDRVRHEGYWHHSAILVSTTQGAIGSLKNDMMNHYRFSGTMNDRLNLREFVATKPSQDENFVDLSTLDYVVRRSAGYKPEVVNYLTSEIETAVKERADFMTKHGVYA